MGVKKYVFILVALFAVTTLAEDIMEVDVDEILQNLKKFDIKTVSPVRPDEGSCDGNKCQEDEDQPHNKYTRQDRSYLTSKDIQAKLDKVTIPRKFKDVQKSMRQCGQNVSPDSISVKQANLNAPQTGASELEKLQLKSKDDHQRLEKMLSNWPKNKPKGAIVMLVQPIPYR